MGDIGNKMVRIEIWGKESENESQKDRGSEMTN